MRTLAGKACRHCDAGLPAQSIGQPRKYCSDACRSAAYNAARRRPRVIRDVSERLFDKLAACDTGCIEFQGHRNEHGYGVIRSNEAATCLAHRITWQVNHGPIPDGLQVLHRCDNPPCCNPDHLFLGTHADNMADRDAKGRTLKGAALRKARWGR